MVNQVFFIVLSLSIWLIDARQDVHSVFPEFKTLAVVGAGIVTSPFVVPVVMGTGIMGSLIYAGYNWNEKNKLLRKRNKPELSAEQLEAKADLFGKNLNIKLELAQGEGARNKVLSDYLIVADDIVKKAIKLEDSNEIVKKNKKLEKLDKDINSANKKIGYSFLTASGFALGWGIWHFLGQK